MSTGQEREQLSGQVEKVIYHDEGTGFCVLSVKARGHRGAVTIVGHAGEVEQGEFVDAEGTWVVDRRHGRQFSADSLRLTLPSTREGIETYLGSGVVKGLGPAFAKRLVDAFGTDVFDVIDNHPDRLTEVDGIGKARKDGIVRGWAEQRAVREIMVFLQSYGVSGAKAFRIFREYGDDAIDVVRENPYRLVHDIRGIGFKSADQIAQRLGIEPDSMMRARAGVSHVMDTLTGYGHCAYPAKKLTEKAIELLEITGNTIPRALEEEIQEGRLVCDTIRGEDFIYPAALFRAESEIARSIARLLEAEGPLDYIDSSRAVRWVQEESGLELSSSQRTALAESVSTKVLVITGGPGVGKTTIVNCILNVFKSKRLKCLLCAPTGRAAKRLSEAAGDEAKTIHRLLEFSPKDSEFKKNAKNPLGCDCVVVDELSMVDVPLMNHLLKAIPSEAIVILVGDADQLPPVGPGNVLSDLIRSKVVPSVILRGVFRQAAKSRIILNAHRINSGQMPLTQERQGEETDFYFVEAREPEQVLSSIVEVVTKRIPDKFGLDPMRDVQVLTPMNKTALGTQALNAELQQILNPEAGPSVKRFGTVYRTGDKVMQIENDYDKNVFNGEIGFVREIDVNERILKAEFDSRLVDYDFNELDELVLSYACTIHKSQGSEYPAVVIPLHKQHYIMLQRNLIYTGVTRARKLLVLVGTRDALGTAVGRAHASKRFSFLCERLIHQIRGEGNLFFR